MSRNSESSPILSGSHVRLAAHPIVIADKHSDGTPIVTLRREGDQIKEIQIRCACGEMIVLDCNYESATETQGNRANHVASRIGAAG